MIQGLVFDHKTDIESPWGVKDAVTNIAMAATGGAAIAGITGGIAGYLKAVRETVDPSTLNAGQRKAYEANLQAIQSEREQYSQALQMIAAQQKNELSQYENIDWKALKEDDPMEYMEKRLEYQDARDQLTRVQQEQRRVAEQQRQQILEQTQQVMQNEAKKLAEVLPAYADPSSNLKNQLRDYALSLGFSQDDLNSIVDHRVVVVLHKAMLQDRAAQGTVRKAKASKPVPKVVKSGTPESKTQRSKKATQQRRERLARTGSTRDATSVFLDLIS